MEVAVIVAAAVIAIILSIMVTYFATQLKLERKFREFLKNEELRWLEEREKAVKEAISQSRAVLGGKFTEQMAPYLPEFRYDPTEARFIGSPVDMVVFPGLSRGDPEEIVIMEIKSGRNSQLTPQEKKIQQLIEEGMVRWELLRKPAEAEAP